MAQPTTDPAGLSRPYANEGQDLPNLYVVDETAWLEEMSRRICEGRYEELDYRNLASYLEDMAGRDRREVRGRLKILLAHLLKWDVQPGYRSGSWKATILVQRQELRSLLASKTLRNYAEEALKEAYELAVAVAISETGLINNTFPEDCPFTIDDLLTAEPPNHA
jgi:hypothetical protein